MSLKTSNDLTRKVAEEYSDAVWNAKKVSIIDQLVDPNVIIHSLLGDFQGIQAMKKIVQAWIDGFPDLIVEKNLIIAENDLVSIQWDAHGTHQGEFKGKKQTGNAVSYSGVTIYRIENEKIVEYWAYLNMQHLLKQIES